MTRDTNGAVNLRSRSASVSRSYRSSLPSSLLRSLRSPSSAAPLSVHLRSRSVPRFTRHSRLRRVLREKKSVNEGPRSVVNRDRVTKGAEKGWGNSERLVCYYRVAFFQLLTILSRSAPWSRVTLRTSHPRFSWFPVTITPHGPPLPLRSLRHLIRLGSFVTSSHSLP